MVYYVLLFFTIFGLWLEKLEGLMGTAGVWLVTLGFFGLVINSLVDLYKLFKNTHDHKVRKVEHKKETSLKRLDQMVGGFLFSFFIMILVSFPLVISILGGVPGNDLNWMIIIGIESLLFFVANAYTYKHFANEHIKKGMRMAYVVFTAFIVVMSVVLLLL